MFRGQLHFSDTVVMDSWHVNLLSQAPAHNIPCNLSPTGTLIQGPQVLCPVSYLSLAKNKERREKKKKTNYYY